MASPALSGSIFNSTVPVPVRKRRNVSHNRNASPRRTYIPNNSYESREYKPTKNGYNSRLRVNGTNRGRLARKELAGYVRNRESRHQIFHPSNKPQFEGQLLPRIHHIFNSNELNEVRQNIPRYYKVRDIVAFTPHRQSNANTFIVKQRNNGTKYLGYLNNQNAGRRTRRARHF